MTNTKTTARRNRQTGTMIEVVPAADFGVEVVPGELRWYTLCVDHNDMCGHATKARAESWAAEPLKWCHGCWTAYCDQINSELAAQ